MGFMDVIKSNIQMDFSDPEYNKTTVLYMTAFFLFYSIIYRVMRWTIREKRPPEYICRLLTFGHGLFCCVNCMYYVCGPALGINKVESIPFQILLSHSMGYFTFDIIWCFVHDEAFIVKFHHVVTCSGLIYYSFKHRQQYVIVYALGLTEITNPLLQTRWYMKYHGMRDSLLFKAIERIFIVSFFSLRTIVFSYYAYLSWTVPELNMTPDDLTFITLGLLVGYTLAWQMFSYIMYQFKKSKRSKKIEKYEQ